MTATSCGSRAQLEHGGWTAENAGQGAKFRDWPLLLGRFAALADG